MAEVEDWENDGEQDAGSQGQEGSTGDRTPRGLRAHAKRLDEENKQLNAKLAEFESAARRARVEKALQVKGFDPGIAEIVPENVAGDDAALDKWLSEKGALFVKKEASPDGGTDQGVEEIVEDAAGFMRVAQVSSAALPASAKTNVMAQIAAASTVDELNAFMKQQGNKYIM